jgi:hypothetical protein
LDDRSAIAGKRLDASAPLGVLRGTLRLSLMDGTDSVRIPPHQWQHFTATNNCCFLGSITSSRWVSSPRFEAHLCLSSSLSRAMTGEGYPSHLTSSVTASMRARRERKVQPNWDDARFTWRSSGPLMQLQLRVDAEPHPHENLEAFSSPQPFRNQTPRASKF